MAWVNFTYASNFADYITLLEGALPAPADSNMDSTVEVLVSETMADQFGIQAGEEFSHFPPCRSGHGATYDTDSHPGCRGLGCDRSNDPYWFYRQSVFENQFFVAEETFLQRIAPALSMRLRKRYGIWCWTAPTSIRAMPYWLVHRITTGSSKRPPSCLHAVGSVAAGCVGALSNVFGGAKHSALCVSIPIIGLLLAFIGLVVGLSVARQRNEIAVLRSRGATVLQVSGHRHVGGDAAGLAALAADGRWANRSRIPSAHA